MDELPIELPFGLSDEEYDIAQSWVSDATPVVYRYEDDVVEDGRHRLWLGWGHFRSGAVPVLASNLLYLRDAFGRTTFWTCQSRETFTLLASARPAVMAPSAMSAGST